MHEMSDNLFLNALDESAGGRVRARAVRTFLTPHQVLCETGDPSVGVYFPESGFISNIAVTSDGREAEVGLFGAYGAFGLIESLRPGHMTARGVVQIPGVAWRLSAAEVRRCMAEEPSFQAAAWAALEYQLLESHQGTLCRSFHPAESRLARWLLECQPRGGAAVPQEALRLTQEYLAAMLGVQRTTVSSLAAGAQKRGLISYTRGVIRILDAPGLEAEACECRQKLVHERQRVLGLAGSSPAPAGLLNRA